ncbi:MAG: hypothetical protein V4582_17620 [Pseudomonadota bacterium]
MPNQSRRTVSFFAHRTLGAVLAAALGACGGGSSTENPIPDFYGQIVHVRASNGETGAGGDGVMLFALSGLPAHYTWQLAPGQPGALVNTATGPDFDSGISRLYVPPPAGTLSADTTVTITASASGGASSSATILLHAVAVAPAWSKLSTRSACEALVARACRGAYGFTVQAQGGYSAGPDPSGKTVTGQLTAAELAQLRMDASTVARGAAADAKGQCERESDTVPGSGSLATLTPAGGGADLVVRSAGLLAASTVFDGPTINRCYFGGQREATISLLADLDALEAKYYPQPF